MAMTAALPRDLSPAAKAPNNVKFTCDAANHARSAGFAVASGATVSYKLILRISSKILSFVLVLPAQCYCQTERNTHHHKLKVRQIEDS